MAAPLPTRKLSSTVTIAIDSNDVLWKTERKMSKVSFRGVDNDSYVEELEHSKLNIGSGADVRRKSLAYLKKELEIDYHSIPLVTLCERLGTDLIMGLGEERRIKNRVRFGRNELTPPVVESNWIKLGRNLTGGLQLLLWAGSFLSFGAYIAQVIKDDNPAKDSLYLGLVLGGIVLLLGCFTFYQEYASDKVMESFSKLVPSFANVVRDGKIYRENCKDLVVGDIVKVKFGDSIPADIRIVECSGFKVDNSSLTGESDPQSRSTDCTHDNPMETKNLAFFSSSALEGTATGIVVSVGDNTFIGRIAGLTSGMDTGDTPMAIEIKHFIKLISCVACIIGITFFIVSLCIGYSLIEAALFLIGIIVANVPEGLLVTFTVILALTAKKMANKNCLVKQLHAVETLGSCSVICSDKTGTLTQNKMSVSHFWFSNVMLDANAEHMDIALAMDTGLEQLSVIARLCNSAKFLPDQENIEIRSRLINGDASESAILRWMEARIGGVDQYQRDRPSVFSVPFNSTNKYQYSIHDMRNPDDRRLMLVMKGAPERIINFCSRIKIGETEYELTSEWREKYDNICEELASMGERVIGFCELMLPEDAYPRDYEFTDENKEYLQAGMRLVGLVSMIDPPRANVAEAVQICRTAGIKVVMVTGDHPTTAKAIARSVGILSPTSETKEDVAKRLNISLDQVKPSQVNAIAITGVQLTQLSSDELDDCLRDHPEIIFARVSPQQKLVIVEAFQRLGKIVAVTGDGVNDSPALKKADIGVAMGISGSDVSKQAADMILLDDNFASIVTGIEEGRLIFDNLKKCIRYLLVANCAELMPFIGLIALRIPLPMGTVPMLMVNLGTDIMPTISLSYESAEDDIMKKPPRNPQKDKLVTNTLIAYSYGQLGFIEALAGYFTYFVIMGQNGFLWWDLLGLSEKWESRAINDLQDSYGQEWSYSSRKTLEHTCWTAFFISVVLCQCGNVLISKTRRVALITKIFDNFVIFFAITFMIGLASFLSYTPGMSMAIGMEPVKLNWWATAVPFIILLMVWDEIRRFNLRTFNWPWYTSEFYY